MKTKRKIALLIETSLSSGRQIMLGVTDFMQERDQWSVFQPTEILGRFDPMAIESWSGEGIIARIANEEIQNAVASKSLPTVDVLGNVESCPFPKVVCDEEEVARKAYEHFASLNFRQFAYFGLIDEAWSQERGDAFRNTVNKVELPFYRFDTSRNEKNVSSVHDYLARIVEWLDSLPKPIGIFLCSDQLGPDLFEACDVANISIPSQIAILSVDNDTPFCEICRPKLSSIAANHRAIGYRAAQLIDQMLDGATPPAISLIEPLVVVSRQSTAISASDDAAIMKAQQAIWEDSCHGITVDDVAKRSGVSRSVLQRKFRFQLQTTINEEILARKLSRAKELIEYTDLSYADVAEHSGFNHQEYLSYIFKKRLGTTPAQFRLHSKRSGVGE